MTKTCRQKNMTKNTPLLLSGFLDGSSFHGMSSPEKRNEKTNIGTISEGSSRDQTSCIHFRRHFVYISLQMNLLKGQVVLVSLRVQSQRNEFVQSQSAGVQNSGIFRKQPQNEDF